MDGNDNSHGALSTLKPRMILQSNYKAQDLFSVPLQ